MKKSHNGLKVFLWIIVALIVFGGITYFSLGLTLAGNFQTKAFCEEVVKDQWCTEGYSCSACTQKTLSYYLTFKDGTKTNKVYQSECVLAKRSPDVCSQSSSPNPPSVCQVFVVS